MSKFLLHQLNDGTPVGVFTKTGHLYLDREKQHEPWGVAVVAQRAPSRDWDDFAEGLAEQWPNPNGAWNIYEHDDAPLIDVLTDAKADTDY